MKVIGHSKENHGAKIVELDEREYEALLRLQDAVNGLTISNWQWTQGDYPAPGVYIGSALEAVHSWTLMKCAINELKVQVANLEQVIEGNRDSSL